MAKILFVCDDDSILEECIEKIVHTKRKSRKLDVQLNRSIRIQDARKVAAEQDETKLNALESFYRRSAYGETK
jgi:hypothetical protein